MLFNKLFVFMVILIGKPCLSENIIGRNQPNGLNELQEAAMKIIKNCCSIQEKTTTLALIGDIPGPFIERLSSDQSFSIILLDDQRRTEKMIKRTDNSLNVIEKVDVLIIIAPDYPLVINKLMTFLYSRYYNTNTFVVMLGWSPENRYAGCDGNLRTHGILYMAHSMEMTNSILICWNNPKGLKIFSFNGFANYAPQPWQILLKIKNPESHLHGFVREYQNNESICENLFFERIHDLQGSPIKILVSCKRPPCPGLFHKYKCRNKAECFEFERRVGFLQEFIRFVNATDKVVSSLERLGKAIVTRSDVILVHPVYLRGVNSLFLYPHGTECKFIVTQFRGYKTQLRKIYDIIDIYSWIGVCIVFLITLLFFKYFLGQPFIIGFLDLCRLTSNFGITTPVTNVGSQIYLACVLFFFVTIQGILTGNLAALLTHDIPNQQVESIQDLADLNYTIYAEETDYIYFDDPIFKGRIFEKLAFDDCFRYVKADYLTACLTWGVSSRAEAVKSNLHVSDCIIIEFITNAYSIKWPLAKKLNKFLGMKISGDTMVNFETLVGEKILLEIESAEIILEPDIMTMSDLGFAFVILVIGWGCAFISFIAEVILHRLNRRGTLTRVIALK